MGQSNPRKKKSTGEKKRDRDPSGWVDLHGDALYRYALLRVKDPHAAEDLVQETFYSALRALDRFKGDSSERTWLIGILKHKVIDFFRKSVREIPSTDLTNEDDSLEMDLFDEKGRWMTPPRDWDVIPSKALEDKEFWRVFQDCLDGLTSALRNVFTMKEIDGMKGEEICKILGISATNLWVILHRSRGRLRKCLESNWFREDG